MLYFKNPMASLFIRSWPLINKHFRDAQKAYKNEAGRLGIDKTMTLFVNAEYLMDDKIHQKISPDVAATFLYESSSPFCVRISFRTKHTLNFHPKIQYSDGPVKCFIVHSLSSIDSALLSHYLQSNHNFILKHSTATSRITNCAYQTP